MDLKVWIIDNWRVSAPVILALLAILAALVIFFNIQIVNAIQGFFVYVE